MLSCVYLPRQQNKVVDGLLHSAALHSPLNEVGKGCVGEGQRQLWPHRFKQLQVLLVLVLQRPQLQEEAGSVCTLTHVATAHTLQWVITHAYNIVMQYMVVHICVSNPHTHTCVYVHVCVYAQCV